MRKKSNVILLYFSFFLVIALFLNNASNPPTGRTNAPFNGACTDCHSPSGSLDGTVALSGLPLTVEAGTTYPMTITVTGTGNAVRAGFQVVSVFSSNNANAGDFIPNSGDEGTNTSGSREYMEHRGPKNFAGGTTSWSFDWQAPQGDNGAEIIMYFAGNVTNGNGSSSGDRPKFGSETFTLSSSAEPLSVDLTKMDVDCNGNNSGSATAAATGGNIPYTYNWSNGQNTGTATNLSAGTYTVTVSDNDGMSVTDNVSIIQPTMLNASTSGSNETANDADDGTVMAIASGGISPYVYSWNNGSNSSTINNLAPATYTVTITDNNGCIDVASFNVQEFICTFNAELVPGNILCTGASTGTIQVNTTNATPPISYQWSNGATTSSLVNLAVGTFSVTIADAANCDANHSVTLTEPQSISLLINSTDPTCNGESNGSITVTPSGGVIPYLYNWSNGATTQSISDQPTGSYGIIVTDDNGCTFQQEILLEAPPLLTLTLSATAETSSGAANGTATATVSGGAQPYDYLWSNGATTALISSLVEGNYSVTITDSNGCIDTNQVNVGAFTCTLAADITGTNSLCYGDSSGSAQVSITQAVQPVAYHWSNGTTTSAITNLAAGIYDVTVSDATNCDAIISVTITHPDSLITMIDKVDPSCPELNDGSISLMVSSGTPPYQLAWSNGATTESLIDLEIDLYTVSVTDANGCGEVNTITLASEDSIAPVIIECSADITASVGSIVKYPLPVVSDNCMVDTLLLTQGLQSGSIFPDGITAVSYDIKDPTGNINTCSFNVTIESSTSVNKNVLGNKIKLFPNPVSSILTLDVENQLPGKVFVSIFSIDGELIRNDSNHDPSITEYRTDVSKLRSGVYYIQLTYGSLVGYKKFIKL